MTIRKKRWNSYYVANNRDSDCYLHHETYDKAEEVPKINSERKTNSGAQRSGFAARGRPGRCESEFQNTQGALRPAPGARRGPAWGGGREREGLGLPLALAKEMVMATAALRR